MVGGGGEGGIIVLVVAPRKKLWKNWSGGAVENRALTFLIFGLCKLYKLRNMIKTSGYLLFLSLS